MTTANLSNPGTLVHARGREWVVLPDSTDSLLRVRPVGGHHKVDCTLILRDHPDIFGAMPV